jgi:hypothetical protein
MFISLLHVHILSISFYDRQLMLLIPNLRNNMCAPLACNFLCINIYDTPYYTINLMLSDRSYV